MERERVNKLEDLDKKSNMQLERQLLMASCWSRKLLTLRGKLKGTEWDPLNSHMITYSEFMALLNSNNVNFMEYANYGQNVSGQSSIFVFPSFALNFKCSLLGCFTIEYRLMEAGFDFKKLLPWTSLCLDALL